MATRLTSEAGRRVLVVPLIRVTPALALLSYAVPKSLEVFPGVCVKIPFRNKIISGIVWADDKTTASREVKAILGREGNFSLTPQQIAVAQWLQRETLTPLNIILRGMIPGEHVATSVHHQEQLKVTVVECPNNKSRQEVITKWSQQLAAATDRTLIVVPNQGAVQQWLVALEKLRPLHLTPPKSGLAQERLRASLRSTNTYITTHSGLLYPLPLVNRVIVDLADDESYFAFNQAPRVDVRALAVAFARIHGASLLVLTRWMSPTVIGLFHETKATTLGLVPPVTVMDRQNEPAGERGRIPPSYLVEKLQSTRTLWLHGRTCEAGRFVCFDCGSTVLCPACKKTLRVKSQKPLILECVLDHLKIEAPSICSVCHGTKLSTRGAGVQQVARIIADVVEAKNVATLESGTVQGDLKTARHVVSTTAIGSHPTLAFPAVVFLQPDSYFSKSGYRSAEEFFSALALARAAVAHQGQLYVVTYKPDIQAYTFLNEPDTWALQAVFEREALHYPPAGTLVILLPRKRISTAAEQPFIETKLPPGVTKTQLGTAWMLRAERALQEVLLNWIRKNLDPTWEAIVNPPTLPSD